MAGAKDGGDYVARPGRLADAKHGPASHLRLRLTAWPRIGLYRCFHVLLCSCGPPNSKAVSRRNRRGRRMTHLSH